MLCDIIYAGERTTFGQPEVKIGTIPGGGGTQRLIRAVGKPKVYYAVLFRAQLGTHTYFVRSCIKAMELILTGRTITAQEAYMWGIISRVLPDDEVFDFALESASLIASYSRPVILMAKEAINTGAYMYLERAWGVSTRVIETQEIILLQPKRHLSAKGSCE